MKNRLSIILISLAISFSISVKAQKFEIRRGAGGGAGAGVQSGNSLYVDIINGNDSTGSRLTGAPFLHISNAVAAANSGDTVIVRPGLYNEFNLLKSNVNYYLAPGVIISNTISAFGAGNDGAAWGIFDDRLPGTSGKSRIDGAGELIFVNSSTFNTNAFGAIVITNALSDLTVSLNKITISSADGSIATFCGVYVRNCKKTIFNIKEITDYFTSGASGGGTGVYWQDGPMFINVEKLEAQVYGFWADEPSTRTTNSVYYTGKFITVSNLFAASPAIYVTSQGSTNSFYRVWISVEEALGQTFAAFIQGSAKVYITAQKLSCVDTANGQTIYNQGELWLNAAKVSSVGTALIRNDISSIAPATSRPVHLTVQHYEDLTTGALQDGIYNTSTNNVYIHGGTVIGGTNFNSLLRSSAGLVFAQDLILDGLNSANTNAPLRVDNNGMILMGAAVLASTVAPQSIFANAARIMEIRVDSYVNRAINANITTTNGFLQVSNQIQSAQINGVQLPGNTALFYPTTYRVFSQTLDSLSNTNTSTATNSFVGTGVGSMALPAGFWQVGRSLKYDSYGRIWTPAAPGNSLYMVNANVGAVPNTLATNIYTTGASMAGEFFEIHTTITCRTNSASVGFLSVYGTVDTTGAAASDIHRSKLLISTQLIFDTTSAMTIDFASTNGSTTVGYLMRNAQAYLVP